MVSRSSPLESREQASPHFLVSTTACAGDLQRYVGSADYSYAFVLCALRPVLEQIGDVTLVANPESRLAFAAERALAAGKRPIHISLHPAHNIYLTPAVPTVLFPFWEFPELPARDFNYDTRQNWIRMCRPVDAVVAACEFTAGAFRQAGVACPVAVAPVPIAPEAFDVPAWDDDWSWSVRCRHLVWDGGEQSLSATSPHKPGRGARGLRARYHRYIRPWLSAQGAERLGRARRVVLRQPAPVPPLIPAHELTLRGLTYTSIFNLSDRRKNVEDLLTAFFSAFRDRADATLVLKLATSPSREFYELEELRGLYTRLGMPHRCRVVVITDFLSDTQMNDLLRASTYYVNVSHAEGACLPLQQAMAAGRPALAPRHTAMRDYIDDSIGYVIESHPEPTFWPHDPDRRMETTWHRLVWADLRAKMLASAELVENDQSSYDKLASSARRRMTVYASRDTVARSWRQILRCLPSRAVGAYSWVA
jgi:glycosyltransferase involved in cell wall biosynthesis